MAQGHSNVRQVGDRIEVLLGERRSQASPEVGAKVEEGIGPLVELYVAAQAGSLGVDDDGVAHLKLEGSCHGCPSSTVTVKLTREQAIAEAAPEVIRVQVEGVAEAPTGPSPSLLQIQTRPGSGSNSNGSDSAADAA